MEYKQTMGKRISDLRKSKGMTQEQLAQQVGVTAQAVSKWENDLSCPDISILPQLAEALGVTTTSCWAGRRCRRSNRRPARLNRKLTCP